MTIIYAASDIHLEFGGPIQVPECDLLLLSGDIFTPWRHPADRQNHTDAIRKRERKFFQQCQDKATRTLMVLGNHEHYNGVFGETAAKVRSRLEEFPTITLLDNEVAEFVDFAVFGATMWTDMNKDHPEVMWHARRNMSDFSVIYSYKGTGYQDPSVGFTPADTVKENTYSKQKMVEFLSNYADKKTIVMTHHAPTYGCIDREFSADILSYAFANTDLDDMLLDNNGPDVWLYGHCHHRKEFLHGDKTSIIANARGYFNYGPESQLVNTFEFKEIVI